MGLCRALACFASIVRELEADASIRVKAYRGAEATLASEWEFSFMAQANLLKGPEFAEAVSAIRDRLNQKH